VRGPAVLLCNPFGEEAVRAHRIYRVLATQLSRAGHPVLRFDYLGTGDSQGDADDVTLDDWIDDIALAAAVLRRESGVSQLAAVGLRLGGTLAARAVARRAIELRHLLMWDPIVAGAAYLRELAAAHVEYMTDELSKPQPPPRMSAEGHPEEVLGHPLSPALARAMAGLDLADSGSIPAQAITVVTTKPSPELRRLEQMLPNARWLPTTTSVPWNSDAALNDAVVPMDILKILMARVQEEGT